jgi:uncharacterized protein (TIGR02246 family)
MSRITAAAAVVLISMGGVGCYSVSADDVAARQAAADRAEIEALMWRYVRALDTRDADAYAAAYTEDGEFAAGTNVTAGRDALRAMVADMRQRHDEAEAAGEAQAPMYHMTMNEHLEFVDEDHARLHAYWQTVFGAVGQTPVRVAAAGRSIDELVRVEGQWLIKSRNVAPGE